jgi:molecular chaperone DnaK (HSP70)
VQRAAVGLDFGTATTLVAEAQAAGPAAIVPLGRSTAWLPSLARVDGRAIVVGEDADDDGATPIRSVKRAITDRRSTVTGWGPDGTAVTVEADAVIAAILAEAARRAGVAGLALSDPGREVRLGCPVLWDGAQRRRLLDVAATAGLAVDLVEEPVAAGLAWLTHRYLGLDERPAGRLLVFDIGGGTLVAGDALDIEMARDIAAEMAARRVDVMLHPRPELAWALIERAAREAKTRLSYVDEHPVVLPPALGYPHAIRYGRARLEAALRGAMDGAETLTLSALRAARAARDGLTAAQLRAIGRADLADDVDFVLLAGGMSRIPYVGRRLAALFPRATVYSDAGVAADEAVAVGLAEAAGPVRVTMHRPGVDLVLEFGGGRRPLYEAYTPLFEPWQIYSGYSDVTYERWLRPPEVPSVGQGRIRAFGLTGTEVGLTVDGRTGPLPVRFGPDGVALRLGPDGTIEVGHADGVTTLFVDGWPVGRDGDRVVLTRVRTPPSP